jgi:hypothetical protein
MHGYAERAIDASYRGAGRNQPADASSLEDRTTNTGRFGLSS